MLCQVYRSSRKEQMYLYVDRGEDLSRVPAELLNPAASPLAPESLAAALRGTAARVDIPAAAAPVFAAASLKLATLDDTSCVPCAACVTFRPISWVAASCSSTA